jgi:hypothetical protein
LFYPYNGYVLEINNEFASAFLHTAAGCRAAAGPANVCHLVNRNLPSSCAARQICLAMEEELRNKGNCGRKTCRHADAAVCAGLSQFQQAAVVGQRRFRFGTGVRVQRYIAQNYNEEILLESSQSYFFVSSFTFTMFLRRLPGSNYKTI